MTMYSVKVPRLNQRKFPVKNTADKSNVVAIVVAGYTFNGSYALTNVCGDWYKDDKGYYYWGGGLNIPQITITPKIAKAVPQPVAAPELNIVEAPIAAPLPTINTLWSDYGITDIWKKINSKGAGISVAVIDTGINYNHPDFINKKNISYYNVVVNSDTAENCMDTSEISHGTSCAGIIASQGSNIMGVSPDVNLIIIKATIEGDLLCSNLAIAINKAIELGAQIISISYGYYSTEPDLPLLAAAVTNAQNKGVLIVASTTDAGSAGVGQQPYDVYPASYSSCIGVGACTINKDFATYSLMNQNLKILGPGDMDVLLINGSGPASGVSYAAPFVAGVCALYLAANPNANLNTLMANIQNTSSDKTVVENQIKAIYPSLSNIINLGIVNPVMFI